jgi:carboxyl-terminal processing protease
MMVTAVLVSSFVTFLLVDDGGFLQNLQEPVSLITGNEKAYEANFDQYLPKLRETYAAIKGNYLRNVTDQQLIDGAIRGMVEALGDPYSEYMDPEEAKQFLSDLESSFTGIGAEVTIKNGRLTIISPIKGSPAEKAGLRPDDQILKVNGQSLEGLSIKDAVSKIRGPKGTKVVLEIARPGVKEVMTITVVRDEIPLHTVDSKVFSGQIGYISISQFSRDTADEFFGHLSKLESQGIKGLIIDVRGNPGGLLPAVLNICEQFVPRDKPVLITEDKAGKREVYYGKADRTKPYPIIVLVDRGSASASEILAGALKESAGALLIGETTFGKGTVQSALDFKDGSNLKLTVAKWLTPKGIWIDQHGGTKGIKPDLEVKKPAFTMASPPVPEKPLKQDDNNVQVKNMQIILDALGFAPGRTDGYFDDRTVQALKTFQQISHLPATGEFDAKTAEALQQAFLSFLQDPKNDYQLQVALKELLKKGK